LVPAVVTVVGVVAGRDDDGDGELFAGEAESYKNWKYWLKSIVTLNLFKYYVSPVLLQ
jgi:hypothetical protein